MESTAIASPQNPSGVPASGQPSHRGQRRLRNLLLDRHFQLKYSGYLMGIALFLSASLGFILWQTSRELIAESRSSVKLGELVVERGRTLLAESEKVNSVVRMNIVQAYADDPGLLEVFQGASDQRDTALAQGQKQLEENSTALRHQSERLEHESVIAAVAIVVALLLLVVGVGLAGVVVTHKVAGPIFKMKRLLAELAKGHFRVVARLRKGDELQAFFDAFNEAAGELGRRQEEHIRQLELALQKLEASAVANPDVSTARDQLLSLRESMHIPLVTRPPNA
jgi:methyl-accepting chemotaxis protein